MKTALKTRLALALTICALSFGSTQAQDNGNYLLNSAHTGAIEFEDGLNLPLRKLWSRGFDTLISYPVVAGGRVFVTSSINAPLVYPYRQGTVLSALDLRTGARLWARYVPSRQIFSFPAADAERVFVLTSDAELRAFDATTGADLWKVSWPAAGGAAPTVHRGMVYVCVSGGLTDAPLLFALNAADGRKIWSTYTVGCTSPTLHNNRLFSTSDCEVHHRNARTGQLYWRRWFQCTSGGGHDSVFYSDRLFMLRSWTPNETIVFNLEGNRVGKTPGMVHPPAFRRGIGYWSNDSSVQAVSLNSGQTLWTFSDAGRPPIPPVVVSGKVFVPSSTGPTFNTTNLFVLHAASGQTLQTLVLDRGNAPGYVPTPTGFGAGDGVIAVSYGSRLFALEVRHDTRASANTLDGTGRAVRFDLAVRLGRGRCGHLSA